VGARREALEIGAVRGAKLVRVDEHDRQTRRSIGEARDLDVGEADARMLATGEADARALTAGEANVLALAAGEADVLALAAGERGRIERRREKWTQLREPRAGTDPQREQLAFASSPHVSLIVAGSVGRASAPGKLARGDAARRRIFGLGP